MTKLTKAQRAEIAKDFASRQPDGRFNARKFVEEVRATGPDHPAYAWFTWDDTAAGERWREHEARDFVRDVKYEIEEVKVTPSGIERIIVHKVPMFQSPIADRQNGGGYRIFDPRNPEHLREHCRQAAVDLINWHERYSEGLSFAGIKDSTVNRIADGLKKKANGEE